MKIAIFLICLYTCAANNLYPRPRRTSKRGEAQSLFGDYPMMMYGGFDNDYGNSMMMNGLFQQYPSLMFNQDCYESDLSDCYGALLQMQYMRPSTNYNTYNPYNPYASWNYPTNQFSKNPATSNPSSDAAPPSDSQGPSSNEDAPFNNKPESPVADSPFDDENSETTTTSTATQYTETQRYWVAHMDEFFAEYPFMQNVPVCQNEDKSECFTVLHDHEQGANTRSKHHPRAAKPLRNRALDQLRSYADPHSKKTPTEIIRERATSPSDSAASGAPAVLASVMTTLILLL